MSASVYGCPKDDPNHRKVWDFMNERMRNDAIARGQPVPADWEWPGDVETLTIDITHKTYYIEITHHVKASVEAQWELSAKYFDEDVQTKESLYPLKNTANWDKRVRRKDKVLSEGFFTFEVPVEDKYVEIMWFPPGMSPSTSVNGSVNTSVQSGNHS